MGDVVVSEFVTVVLGGGRSLFAGGGGPVAFELVDCRPAAQCAILVYRRTRV